MSNWRDVTPERAWELGARDGFVAPIGRPEGVAKYLNDPRAGESYVKGWSHGLARREAGKTSPTA